jgi:hypothetical protein
VVSNLGYTSCGRFDIIGMKGLNRINDYNFARSLQFVWKIFEGCSSCHW